MSSISFIKRTFQILALSGFLIIMGCSFGKKNNNDIELIGDDEVVLDDSGMPNDNSFEGGDDSLFLDDEGTSTSASISDGDSFSSGEDFPEEPMSDSLFETEEDTSVSESTYDDTSSDDLFESDSSTSNTYADDTSSDDLFENDSGSTDVSLDTSSDGDDNYFESDTSSSYASFDTPSPLKLVPVKKIKSEPYQIGNDWINRVYLIREGDSLYDVSQKIYGNDRVKDLKKWNPYFYSKSPKVGDKVYYSSIKNPGDSMNLITYYQENNMTPKSYTARSGDNIRNLSKDWLGHERSWMEVWATNPDVISKWALSGGENLQYWPDSNSPVQSFSNNNTSGSNLDDPFADDMNDDMGNNDPFADDMNEAPAPPSKTAMGGPESAIDKMKNSVNNLKNSANNLKDSAINSGNKLANDINEKLDDPFADDMGNDDPFADAEAPSMDDPFADDMNEVKSAAASVGANMNKPNLPKNPPKFGQPQPPVAANDSFSKLKKKPFGAKAPAVSRPADNSMMMYGIGGGVLLLLLLLFFIVKKRKAKEIDLGQTQV